MAKGVTTVIVVAVLAEMFRVWPLFNPEVIIRKYPWLQSVVQVFVVSTNSVLLVPGLPTAVPNWVADGSNANVLLAALLLVKTGDTVKISSVAGSIVTKLKLWEGVRPGTVAKCFGQGHWAYGRVAAKDYARAQPRGGNNNEILVDDYDRLSGSTARNGGFTGVRVQKA